MEKTSELMKNIEMKNSSIKEMEEKHAANKNVIEKREEQIRELEDNNMLNENVIKNLNLQLNKAGEVNETEKSEECENVNNNVLPKNWVKAYDCHHKFDDML